MNYYDVNKIANAIIYFIEQDVKNLGITKLMKLFFYADKYHLEKYSKPIFNHTYTKLPRGPVPTWLYSIIRTSASGVHDIDFASEVAAFNSYLSVEEAINGQYKQVEFNALKDFDNDFFSRSQIKILNKVIEEFKDITAKEISKISHETKGWKSVNMNQQITYDLMVDDESTSDYLTFIQTEKESFRQNLRRHILDKVS